MIGRRGHPAVKRVVKEASINVNDVFSVNPNTVAMLVQHCQRLTNAEKMSSAQVTTCCYIDRCQNRVRKMDELTIE